MTADLSHAPRSRTRLRLPWGKTPVPAPENPSPLAIATKNFQKHMSAATLHELLAHTAQPKSTVNGFLTSLSEAVNIKEEVCMAEGDIRRILEPEDYDRNVLVNISQYHTLHEYYGKPSLLSLAPGAIACIKRILAIASQFPDMLTNAVRETGIEFLLQQAPQWFSPEDFVFLLDAARDLAKYRAHVGGDLTRDELLRVSRGAQMLCSPFTAYEAHKIRLSLAQ